MSLMFDSTSFCNSCIGFFCRKVSVMIISMKSTNLFLTDAFVFELSISSSAE